MKKYLKILTLFCAMSASHDALCVGITIPGMPQQVATGDNTLAFTCVNDGQCFTLTSFGGGLWWVDVHWPGFPIGGPLGRLQDAAGQIIDPHSLVEHPLIFNGGIVALKVN
jgi:hypothetical protein